MISGTVRAQERRRGRRHGGHRLGSYEPGRPHQPRTLIAVSGGGYGGAVIDTGSGDPVRVTTTAQLARMTPAERQAHVAASAVTDLSPVRPDPAPVRARPEQRTPAQDASRQA